MSILSGRAERASLVLSALLHGAVILLAALSSGSGQGREGVLRVDVISEGANPANTLSAAAPEERAVPAPRVAARLKTEAALTEAPIPMDMDAGHTPPEPPEGAAIENAPLLPDSPEDDSALPGPGHEPGGAPQPDGETVDEEDMDFGAPGTAFSEREGRSGGGAPYQGRLVVIERIKSSIQGALLYPALARKRGMEGTVVAGFFIDAGGLPRGIRVIKSSGHGILDREVVSTIKRASPYPFLDGGIEVPVTFRLMDG
jgi:protein TonB